MGSCCSWMSTFKGFACEVGRVPSTLSVGLSLGRSLSRPQPRRRRPPGVIPCLFDCPFAAVLFCALFLQ